MKRRSDIFVVFCFLAFLVCAMAITVLSDKDTYSYFENRNLAAMPEYTAQSDGDGSYVVQLEKYLADHTAGRNILLRVKTCLDLLLHRPVVNEVVLTEDRLLPYQPAEVVDPAAVSWQANALADRLRQISDTVESYGGYYCYTAVPCQYAYYPDDYPRYLNNREEYTEQSIAALTAALEERGVNFLDLGAAFDAQGHPDSYGSKVDNHYTMRGAFEAYRLVLEKIKGESGLDFPILGEEDVTFEDLPNRYMGSRERKLLGLVNREEPLSILKPKEEVPFTLTNSGLEGAPTVYALPGNNWEQVAYTMYMGGDLPETVIDTGREDLPSVLIYGDSFTNAMECVLYLSFDKMYSLDFRYYQDMTLEEYIQMVKPDVVFCVRDYEALLSLEFNGGGVHS